MNDNSFGKEYKLCSKRVIEDLFENGASIKSYPFVLKWMRTDLSTNKPFQIAFSIPKRNFKSAVQRNYIKRKCREALRLNKGALESLCSNAKVQIALFLIFTAKEDLTYEQIDKKIKKLVDNLMKEINEGDIN